MQTNSSENQTIISPHNNSGTSLGESRQPKPPRQILDGLFSFHPNRETLGGTSYLIVENTGNILVDSPAWDSYNQQFLHQKGVRWLFLTHRGGIGKQVLHIQTTLGCEVVIQEQEAYLLPEVKVRPFEREFFLSPTCYGLWTPGHTPGSSCLYWNHHGGVLFTGRHLLPNPEGILTPLRTAKTFHWLRQLRGVELLRDRFSSETLTYVCPGANIGFLRGRGISRWAELNLKT